MAQATAASPDLALDDLAKRRRQSFYGEVLRRLVREKPLGLFGAIVIVVFTLAALVAPLILAYGPNELGAGGRLEDPSFTHPFGTDNLGRDVFARVIHGARVSMWIGLLSVLTATLLSMTIGVTSGYFGGKLDMLMQRIVDAFIAFPGLVFILAVVAMFRDSQIPGTPNEGLLSTDIIILVIAIGILSGVGSSRIIRSATLSVRATAYVEAARSLGATNWHMIRKHIIPNVMAPVITLATLGFGTAILLEASLSFLGLGVPPNVPSWGGMLNREARGFMTQQAWLALGPGIALSLAVFAFNMLGDALRDLLDPRLRGGGGSFH